MVSFMALLVLLSKKKYIEYLNGDNHLARVEGLDISNMTILITLKWYGGDNGQRLLTLEKIKLTIYM